MKRKVLHTNEWVSTVLLNNWYVATEETRSISSKLVAVLPYRKTADGIEYLVRYEKNSAHMQKPGEAQLSVITGACETGDENYHAQQELYEEGGYLIPQNRFNCLGYCSPLKSSCAMLFMYTTRILRRDKHINPPGDKSGHEAGDWCEWLPIQRLTWAKDPYIHTILARLGHYIAK